ncbi:hypothetical protein CC78DRAFT_589293 [Lojkania enalia]|uniref:Mid2 domain-containing protein n=1 Tax=Lojkania enalia TaxID=147567 RepID=A0A9P4KGK3_9PLEO|nr:hypothetical protein CC78DRAFT_589293 [Didymosphaeria enalia]
MVNSVSRMIRLCWILCWFLPLVRCQFGNSPFDPFSPGGSRGPIGNLFPGGGGGGFRNPNRFPQNFPSPPNRPFQNGQPDRTLNQPVQGPDEQVVEEPPVDSIEPTPTLEPSAIEPSETAPASISAVPDSDSLLAISGDISEMPIPDQEQATSPIVPAPPPAPQTTPVTLDASPSVAQPSLDISTTSAAVPPSSTPVEAEPVLGENPSLTIPSTGPLIPLPTTTTSTTTSSKTILVTANPLSTPPLSSPQPIPAPVSSPDPSSTLLNLAPISTSPGMSPAARAGLGVGISFGLISIASIIGLYIYRRRKSRVPLSSASHTSSSDLLGGFFHFARTKTRDDDAEWSIHSAEKIEIVRGASSVRTGSRSDSRGSAISSSGGGKGIKIERVGLDVFPERRTPNPALTSNPVVGSPPDIKKASWPLPD